MKDKLAIIVPFRDRQKHLDVFVPHMHNFLQDKGIDYDIFIVEQADDRPFNYGKLCNAAVKEVGEEYNYFAFHDIDMLPISDECDYGYPDSPTHLATNVEAHNNELPYPQYFGGVVLISREDFENANGYSNEYWGYGFEDLDLLYRLQKSGAYLEKFYDTNRTYSKYDEDDILPYRIEKVSISNQEIKQILNTADFSDSYVNSSKSILFNNLLGNSFSFSLWFKNKNKTSNKKNILTFQGYDSGFFISEKNYLITQVWDTAKKNYDISKKYKLNEWNHLVFNLSLEKSKLTVYLNNKKTELKLPDNFKLYDYSLNNILISDETSEISIADLMFFNQELESRDVDSLYYEGGYTLLDKIKNNKELIPVSYFKFDNLYKNKFILDSGKYHNHLKLNGIPEFSKEKIVLSDKIYLPTRLSGEYKSLAHELDKNIIDRYYMYNPDIEENADIFFHEVLTDKLNYNTIGLNNLKFKVLDKQTKEKYELIRIIT